MTFSFSNTPLYVREGQTLQFKYKAPSTWDTTETVVIRIGLLEQYWFITTIPEDFSPDPFFFYDINNAQQDTLYVYADGTRAGEELVVVSGLTPGTAPSISLSTNTFQDINDFAIRIRRAGQADWERRVGGTDGDGWFIPGPADTVQNGDVIQLRLKSSEFSSTRTTATLRIGNAFETWSITTKEEKPNIPVPFPDFNDLFNIFPGSEVYSNILRVQGLSEPAIVNVGNLDATIGISSSNASFTNDNGYDVLSNTSFVSSNTNPVIVNGQYIQLKFVTPLIDNETSLITLSVGDKPDGSTWSVTNTVGASTSIDPFVFIDAFNVLEDSLISSDTQPLFGITGLGNDDVEVDVVLLNTTGTEPRVQITDRNGVESSIGLFPAKVKNGYKIKIYNRSSATFGETVRTQIKVGKTEIATWSIVTNSGPDTDAIFTPPANLTNRKPSTGYGSSIIGVNGINRPIEINATNGALISIDFDTPEPGPRTFDPNSNNSFRVFLTSPTGLNQTASTSVTVGTGTSNNPFTWSITTYAVEPPPKTNLGRWYSKKTDKFDGYSIGTVISIPKEGDGTYGDLGGALNSRYPGYLECDGSSYSASDYPDLWWVIGNTYGGDASYDELTRTYTGEFRVPDYRNRKLTGTGIVDGNRGSSAFVPVTTVGKGIYDVGAEGGYWYIDSVDVGGPLPYEQIFGEEGAQSGETSPFFVLGSPTTVFDSPVTAETEFEVAGSLTGVVGPLSEVILRAPVHTHLFITAQVESDSGDPLIKWGTRTLGFFGRTFPNGGVTVDKNYTRPAELGGGPLNPNNLTVTRYLEFVPDSFESEYNSIDGVDPLESIVSELISGRNRRFAEITTKTWFLSPYGVIADSQLKFGTTAQQYAVDDAAFAGFYGGSEYDGFSVNAINRAGSTLGTAVIDTKPGTFRIDTYANIAARNPHSHFLTLQPITNPDTDYGYGNVAGPGIKNGLGGAAPSLTITFNQNGTEFEQGVDNSLNPGTFTLNQTIKKPVPNVEFVPNRKVPLIPQFHKVKYVIKAY